MLASLIIGSLLSLGSLAHDSKAYLKEHGSQLQAIELSSADDELLEIVKDHCPHLKSLSLACKAKTATLLNLLKACKELQTLSLTGLRIKPVIAKEIGNHTNLVSLKLANCSMLGQKKSDDYKALLSKQTNLQVLSLGKCEMFSHKHCQILAKFSLKELSLAGSTWMFNEGLKKLCDSKTLQKSLTSLELTNAHSIDSNGFEPLKKLSLKTLRLQNCLWFNDRSLSLIMNDKLIRTLETLELEKVYISDAHQAPLGRCLKLKEAITRDLQS